MIQQHDGCEACKKFPAVEKQRPEEFPHPLFLLLVGEPEGTAEGIADGPIINQGKKGGNQFQTAGNPSFHAGDHQAAQQNLLIGAGPADGQKAFSIPPDDIFGHFPEFRQTDAVRGFRTGNQALIKFFVGFVCAAPEFGQKLFIFFR